MVAAEDYCLAYVCMMTAPDLDAQSQVSLPSLAGSDDFSWRVLSMELRSDVLLPSDVALPPSVPGDADGMSEEEEDDTAWGMAADLELLNLDDGVELPDMEDWACDSGSCSTVPGPLAVLSAPPTHDVAEYYSPPRVVPEARLRGLVASLSLDLVSGWDFRLPHLRSRSLDLLTRLWIFFVVLSPPCTAFSQLQALWNYPKMAPERVACIWGECMMYLDTAMEVARAHIAQKRYFVFEHPAGASSWGQPVVQEVQAMPSVMCIVVDQCMVGVCTKVTGTPTRNRTRLMTNSRWMATQFAGLQCSRDHTHERIQGVEGGIRRSVWAQVYPPRMVELLVQGIEQTAMAS